MNRANYLPAPHFFNLNQACRVVWEAFARGGGGIYLVGSSLERRDYRDVDVRCILPDAEFARLFGPNAHKHGSTWHPLWSVMCSSISLYLAQHSGLPVDFQIQQQTAANSEYQGKRSAIGLFLSTDHDDPPPDGLGPSQGGHP